MLCFQTQGGAAAAAEAAGGARGGAEEAEGGEQTQAGVPGQSPEWRQR